MTPDADRLLALLRSKPRLSDRKVCAAMGLSLGEVAALAHTLRLSLGLKPGASLR